MAYDNNYGYAQNGYTQYLDNSGKPLTGGSIETYIAGTTTPVLTFKDFNGGQNPHKITLDENGGATVILKQDIVYKFIIRDKNGDIFKTIDNIVTGGTTTVVEVDAQIPIASESVLGGIKVGKNLTIEPDGTLNATGGGGSTYTAGDGIAITDSKISVNAGKGLGFDNNNKLEVKVGDGLTYDAENKVIKIDTGVTTTVSEITENTTVTLVAGQNRYLTCTNTPTISVEITDDKAYHLQINGTCTINLTGVSWSGDEITDITTKAEISILNGIAVGVLYE